MDIPVTPPQQQESEEEMAEAWAAIGVEPREADAKAEHARVKMAYLAGLRKGRELEHGAYWGELIATRDAQIASVKHDQECNERGLIEQLATANAERERLEKLLKFSIDEKRYYRDGLLVEAEAERDRYKLALEKIAAETIYTYDDGNEGPMIKYRAKEVALAALSSVQEKRGGVE